MNNPIEQVAQLLEAHSGNVSAVARNLGISRQALYKRIHRSKRLQDALEEGRLALIGEAQNVLQEKLAQKNLQAAIFVLKTWGKDFGFTERVEVESDHPQVIADW